MNDATRPSRRGRPRLPDGERRAAIVSCRVPVAMHDRLIHLARQQRLTLAEWLVRAVYVYEKSAVGPDRV